MQFKEPYMTLCYLVIVILLVLEIVGKSIKDIGITQALLLTFFSAMLIYGIIRHFKKKQA